MSKNKLQKAIVGYVRSAIKDDLSVKKQGKQIREYCLENGYKLAKVFIDNGCSGANTNRPALQELLVEVSVGKISKVVCLDLSRLSRNTFEYATIKSQLKKHGVELVCTTGIASNEATAKMEDELIATINAFQSLTHHKKSKEQHISVDKQNRFKRSVKISVTEKDLNNMPKFHEMLKDSDFYGCTCSLSRSQIVLIAKILRLNLENDIEVKAEFRF